jgi:hypothetical protein
MQNSNGWRCFERLVLCGYVSGYLQFPLIQKTQKQQRERKGQNSMQTPYLVKSWKTSKKSYLQVLEKKNLKHCIRIDDMVKTHAQKKLVLNST